MLYRLRASKETVHCGFYDAGLKPVLKIWPGDSVDVDTISGAIGLLNPKDEELMFRENPHLREIQGIKDRGPGPHILTGPIEIRGADRGDALMIGLKKIAPSNSFGWNAFLPNYGALPEDYPYTWTRVIRYDSKKKLALFSPRVRIPLFPFFGHHGVAPPSEEGRVSSTIPGTHGGNLDNKEVGVGSVLMLPVHVPGALYSVGDGHAVQGDGEVDETALETSMRATLNFDLEKGVNLEWPMVETGKYTICMGFHEDLDEATKIALRNMIGHLVERRRLDRDEAYALCSMVVDLRVTQLVNGLKGVHALLPKTIFKENATRKTSTASRVES